MSRRIAVVAIAVFLGWQGVIAASGLFGRGSFFWIMFVNATPRQRYLEVSVITPRGDEIPVPLGEALPFHVAQTEWKAFSDRSLGWGGPRPARLARWLGRFMERRGVPVSGITLSWRVHDLETGAVTREPYAEYPLEAEGGR
jgi:hypothetical protein